MDFRLSEDQELLRETARTLLARECPPSLLRAAIDDPEASAALDARLAAFEDVADAPTTDLVLLTEELGAVAAPGTFLVRVGLGAPFTALRGGGPAATLWCTDTDTLVPEAAACDVVVVAGPGATLGLALDARLEPVETIDCTRRFFRVERAGVETVPVDVEAFAAARRRATAAVAAELVGVTRALVAVTLEYVRERVQFDRPIGSFQAVQHRLADMALDLERARAAVAYAAMTNDASAPDAAVAAHAAKAAASTAALRAMRGAIQLHGGIGYTWEHDLHLYLRRAQSSATLLGGVDWHLDRVADLVVGPAPSPR